MVSYTIGATVLLGLILTATETSAQDDRYIVKDKESTSDAAIGAHLGEFAAISAATDEDHGSRYLRSSDRGMSDDVENNRRLQEEPTILDILNSIPDLSVLAVAVDAAGLDDALSGPGPFTVFGKYVRVL